MGNTYAIEVCNKTTNDIIHVDIQGSVDPAHKDTSMASFSSIRPHCSHKFEVGNPTLRNFFFGAPMFADAFWSLFGLSTIQCSVVAVFQNSEKDDFVILLRRQNEIELQFTQQTHDVEVIKMRNGQDYRITFRHTEAQITDQKAEQLHQKGITRMMNDRFSKAQTKFDEALEIATEKSTKEAIRSSMKELRKSMDQKAKRMHMEGFQFLKINRVDKALTKFEESLKLANESDTIDTVTKSRNETRNLKILEENSLEFKQKAERLLALHQYDAALEESFNALEHAVKDKTRTLIKLTINTIEETKINEQKCEETLKEVTSLLKEHDYETCLTKLEEALKIAKKEDTIHAIKNKISEAQEMKMCEGTSQQIISDAQKFLREYLYEKPLHTFETALNYATKENTLALINDYITNTQEEQKNQAKSERLNEEAQTLTTTGQYEPALKKFDEALKYAQNEALIDTITTNKADVLNRYGEDLFAEAFRAEQSRQNKSKEIYQNLSYALTLFQKAYDIKKSDIYKENIEITKIKIEGIELYDEGVKLQNQTFNLTQNIDCLGTCKEAKRKYNEARKIYQEAREIFKKGAAIKRLKFQPNIQLCIESVIEVNELLEILEEQILEFSK